MTNRYENSKVYKLVNNDGYYYCGSTCLPLHKRFYNHKVVSKRRPQRSVYCVFNHDRFLSNEINIILVQAFNLDFKEKLLKEENTFIEQSLKGPKCLNNTRSLIS